MSDLEFTLFFMVSLIQKCIGAAAYKLRLVSNLIFLCLWFFTMLFVLLFYFHIYKLAVGSSVFPLLVPIACVLGSLLFTIAWSKLSKTFKGNIPPILTLVSPS